MGALRQPKLGETEVRKPPASERTLDRFGRDPNSALEKLRGQTDYDKDTGYSPLYHAVLADLPRISGHSAVGLLMLLQVLRLSLGAPREGKGRNVWTAPISTTELAELCGANIRDIQRQLDEGESRGVLAVKQVRKGSTLKYSVSLLLSKWRSIEDYAVWKRRQVVAIDEALGQDEPVEDESPIEISTDSIVVKKPQRIAPGRASKAVKVNAGVTEFVFQNDSEIPAVCSAVLQSGRFVATVKCEIAQGENKAKKLQTRDVHVAGLPPNEGSTKSETPRQTNGNGKLQLPPLPPRAAELHRIFDPLLAHSGASLLSMDGSRKYSDLACVNVGDCDHDYLCKFVAHRTIKSVTIIPDICGEALASWRVAKTLDAVPSLRGDRSEGKKGFAERLKDEAARRLNKYGRI